MQTCTVFACSFIDKLKQNNLINLIIKEFCGRKMDIVDIFGVIFSVAAIALLIFF